MMTLYAGQTKNSVTPLETEKGLTLFDEDTRKQANNALKTGVASYELKSKLESMYVDGSHQAGYFLGTMVIQGVIEYPIAITKNKVSRGNAGPGMEGPEYERMVENMRMRIFTDMNDNETDSPVSTLDYLRARGIDDVYSAIEEE